MSDDDTQQPINDLGWSSSPDAMRRPELRERLTREWTGSSKEDAWAQRARKWWRFK